MQSHPEPASHYENFPVASLLLPAHLRGSVRVIYAFARSADDLADEGNAEPQARIDALNAYEDELNRIEQGQAPLTPLFAALAPVVVTHAIPLHLLRELLSAFRHDVVRTRYANIEMLLDYCRRSANPVGRIMLGLFTQDQPQNLERSDAICSALQIINFLQDVAIDWDKARVYLPQEDLHRFGVSEQQIANAEVDSRWRELMAFEVARARQLMRSGAPLALDMPGRFGWELRLIVLGGLRILEKIEAVGFDVFRRRPTLNKRDWLLMGWRALRFVV
jgi:squalene synthase HpnC